MHVFTHLKKESQGKTGLGTYPDGMVETDGHVGELLNLLDELKVADNTVVVYTTDNGAECVTWSDGGSTPFKGEKDTNWREAHPGVSVTLLGTDKEAPLQEDGVDFRLCYGDDARKYDRFAELFIDAVVPVCSPDLLRRHPVRTEADIITAPLIDIAWEARHRSPPTWVEWAWSVGLATRETPSTLAFSQSDAAVEAALCGAGFALGQISTLADHVRQGRLTIPIDRRLTMPEPYLIAWDRDTLDRPLAAAFRDALIAAGRQQSALSSGKEALVIARRKT